MDDPGLVLGGRQRAGLESGDREARAQRGVQLGLHRLELGLRLCLHVDLHRRLDRIASGDDAVAPQPRVTRQDRADRLRVDVHRLHAQHVVAAAVDADPWRGAPTGAGRGPQTPEVAGAIAQERRGLAAQVGPHELPARFARELQRVPGVRVHELEQGMPLRGQVQPLALPTGGAHRRPDVAHPERVGHRGAPGLFDLGADAARPAPGSPAVRMWRTPRAAGSKPASRARAAR